MSIDIVIIIFGQLNSIGLLSGPSYRDSIGKRQLSGCYRGKNLIGPTRPDRIQLTRVTILIVLPVTRMTKLVMIIFVMAVESGW